MEAAHTHAGRPLYLPDVHTFGEMFTDVVAWDDEANRPMPRYIPETTPTASAWERKAWRSNDGRNEIGPYCTVELTDRRFALAVRATDAVIEAMRPVIVTPDDHLSFQVIEHADGRALVLASHNYIIGSIWLGFIDPASVPDPMRARDERYSEIADALREGGHDLFRRNLAGGAIELSAKDAPPLAAVIHPDGSVTRTWADGTITQEAGR